MTPVCGGCERRGIGGYPAAVLGVDSRWYPDTISHIDHSRSNGNDVSDVVLSAELQNKTMPSCRKKLRA